MTRGNSISRPISFISRDPPHRSNNLVVWNSAFSTHCIRCTSQVPNFRPVIWPSNVGALLKTSSGDPLLWLPPVQLPGERAQARDYKGHPYVLLHWLWSRTLNLKQTNRTACVTFLGYLTFRMSEAAHFPCSLKLLPQRDAFKSKVIISTTTHLIQDLSPNSYNSTNVNMPDTRKWPKCFCSSWSLHNSRFLSDVKNKVSIE